MSQNTNNHPKKPQWERDLEPLDFSASSSATDPEHAAQDESTRLKMGRHRYTENATFTKEDMEGSDESHYTLNELNRNFVAAEDESIGTRQDTVDEQNEVKAWGRQIELTSNEIERAQKLVKSADSGMKNAHGKEAMSLAALTIAANEDTAGEDSRKSIRRNGIDWGDDNPLASEHPLERRSMADEREQLIENYETLREDLGVDRDSVKACRGYLRRFL
jgi:cysteinyl-tRNA synthetase